VQDGRTVGRVGTAVRHHELGPVALALVKRTVVDGADLLAGPVAARVDDEPAFAAAGVAGSRGRGGPRGPAAPSLTSAAVGDCPRSRTCAASSATMVVLIALTEEHL
jgi:hypothetical protein